MWPRTCQSWLPRRHLSRRPLLRWASPVLSMKQRLLLGENGLEPLPEPLEEAPKLLLPYPLGEPVQGLSGRGRAGQGRAPGKAPRCGGKWP